jgi:DNA-binding transcriptional LysR family regulator
MEPDRWLGVELRHLAALEAVARERSFGRAAESLGYTPSAVSQQIATLERAVGERLVERPGGPRPVALTEAGELLLGHAGAIVARLKAAQADLRALGEGRAGTLRVGAFQSVGSRILPDVVRRFLAGWPDVDLHLHESSADDELLGLIERGELDVAFVMLPIPEGPFETIELLRDPYVLIARVGSDLAAGPSAKLADLRDEPLVGNRLCRSSALAENALRLRGLEPLVSFRSDDNGTVQGLVAAGLASAVMPLLSVDETDDRVVVLPLEPALPPRLIGFAWHRDRQRSAAARAFVDCAVELCTELAEAAKASASIAARPAANCARVSRTYECRPRLRGSTPAASTGGATRRSPSTSSGRIGMRHPQRSRVGSCSSSLSTSAMPKTTCQPAA